MTPTAPTPADVARASSIVEAWRRSQEQGWAVPTPILEAAETLSAALHAERIQRHKDIMLGDAAASVPDHYFDDSDDRVPLLHVAGWLGVGLCAWVACVFAAVWICQAVGS